jgi:hypothetical protein
VNRQSNLKLNYFKQDKSGGPDISGLVADLSNKLQICPVQDQICLVNQDYEQWKSRSVAKAMNLGADKLTTSKQDTTEHIEIRGSTRCNLFTRNHT